MPADASKTRTWRPPAIGEPAPDFVVPSSVNPRFVFNTIGGRYVALAFLSDNAAANAQALTAVRAARELFDDAHAAFLAVSTSDSTEAEGLRTLHDDDGAVARQWGVDPAKGGWRVVDPGLRIVGIGPLAATENMLNLLRTAAPPSHHAGVEGFAPVLLVPRVFEVDLCRELIAVYRAEGGKPSGFMRFEGGKTVLRHDPNHKRRADVELTNPKLMAAARARVLNRLAPEVAKAFAFEVTRMERYIVSRYGAEEQGFFRAHRDNTTSGTAHRRFAVTINLNAEDYEGGELRFPEYARRTYKPPTGAAVVFSCSLLHEATPVTKGERFAFLPFLYDEAAAQLRERNAHTVEGGEGYRAGPPTLDG